MLARHGRLHQGSLARISWSTWTGFARIARDISPALSGFEPHCEPGLLELLGGGIHDGEIHAANKFGVFSGQRVEGAIAQHDGAATAVWLVPFFRQRVAGAAEKPLGTWSSARRSSRLVCDIAAPAGGRGFQGVGGGGALCGRVFDGTGEQLSDEVVSAFRQDHR